MRPVYILFTFLASVIILSCNPSAKETHVEQTCSALEEAKKAIAESNSIYFDAFVKNDSSIFMDRYAKDACIMAPNVAMMCGQGAAANFFSVAYNDFGLRGGKFITTAVYGDATEYVTEEGLWQSFNAQGEVFDDGKFLVVWKNTPDGWKMFRDSFSGNHTPK